MIPDNAPLLSIVVPCYNEEENILPLYTRLRDVVGHNTTHKDVEILLVDDGSSDTSWKKICELCARDPVVTAIRLSRNFGHQMALTCGLEHALGQRVFVIDADLQDPPELLADMMTKMDEGYDVVYGQRVSREGEPSAKKLSSWFYYRILSLLSEVRIPLDTGDFRLMTHHVVEALCAMPERVRYTRGLISWLGFNQTPLPYVRQRRFSGQTHYTLRKMLGLAMDGVTSFSTRPLQLATWLGMLMMVVSTLLLGYVFISWLFFNTVRGWTSLAAIFLLSQAFQWLVLGIIGNYIAVIFRETKSRPLYIIRDRANPHSH